jgi:hypothetical protein
MKKILVASLLTISILFCNAQMLVGLQAHYTYNHNKRGMLYTPSFYPQLSAGISGYINDKYLVEIGGNRHRVIQNYSFERLSPAEQQYTIVPLSQQALTHLYYNGLNLQASRLFGTYEKKVRCLLGLGFGYNSLYGYNDYFLSRAASLDPSIGTLTYVDEYDRSMHFRTPGGGTKQLRDLNKWLYKKQDIRALLNAGLQIQASKHIFLLLNLQAQHGLAGVETPGEITSYSKQFQVYYTKLGLQERYDCKYETFAPVKGPLRSAETYTRIAGASIGFRFQFGRYDY